MRISDWSSDVCSSDLGVTPRVRLYRWEFEKDGREVSLQLSGPLVLDTPDLMISAALDGVGLAYATEAVTGSAIEPLLASGRLIRVLEEWCPPFPGFFLYYRSEEHTSALQSLMRISYAVFCLKHK